MSMFPPTDSKPSKPSPKRKPRAGRKPAAKPSPDFDIRGVVEDTPNPPTEPVPEPEIQIPRSAPSKPRAGSLESRLNEAFAGIALLPSFAGDGYSSFIIASRSQKFAHDLAELAKVNPRIKRILESALDGGAYGGVMFSGAAMLLPILWNYGILPSPGFDPFAALYPPVPAELQQRKQSGRAGGKGGPTTPGQGRPTVPVREAPAQSSPTPEGVVTVRPGAHPPVNPAAGQ